MLPLLPPCLQMLSARIDAAQQAAQLAAPDEMPVVRDSLSRLHLVSRRQQPVSWAVEAGEAGAPAESAHECASASPTPLLTAACLQVRCHNSFDFLAALCTLRPRLDALAGSPAGLACLLIDNVAAHYYLDRAARGAPAGAAANAYAPCCRGCSSHGCGCHASHLLLPSSRPLEHTISPY